MTTLAQDLGGVVRLLEKATPGEWPEPEASRFVPDKFNVGDGAPYMLVGRDKNDLRAAVAAVNFLRTHSAEIAGALRDAERYRWLREQASWWMVSTPDAAKLSVMLPRASIDAAIGTEGCDFDAAIDSAMQQGGGE